MIRYLEVSGTEYEMGFQLGQAFAAYLQSAALGMEETLAQGAIREKAERLEGKLKAQLPACLEEIYGRADGAKIPRSLALLLFFPEISKRADGCTTAVIQRENGKFLFCHNEDDEHYTTENVALVKYQYGDFWITGYTAATKLVGSSFAWNSAGMVFSSNYIYDTKIQLENISRYVAVRDVMNAKSLEEAVRKLREAKVASAFSLNILDLNENRAVNIEKDTEEIYPTPICERYARANHFIAKTEDLPQPPVSSAFRCAKANELIAQVDRKTASISDLQSILMYETQGYNESIYMDAKKYPEKGVTVANFSYDGESGKIAVRDYLGGGVMEFEYR